MDVDQANAALLESWELDLRSPVRARARPKRDGTTRLYVQEARRFVGWLATHGRPVDAPGDLAAVARGDVAAWIGDLRANGRSEYTVRNRWIVLRSLYGWAAGEDVIPTNPLERVQVPKVDEPAPDVLDDTTVAALLAACRGTGFADWCDLALIRLLLATGLRASELCALRIGDVDLRTRIVSVVDGKGGRSRLGRFDPGTAAALDRYRRVRGRHRYASRPELWIGHRGPLSRKGLGPILDRRAAAAGIGHVHPTSCATRSPTAWKKAGATSEGLGQLGGWSSPEVLKRYGASLAVERSLEVYDRLDPMAGL